MQIIEEFKRDLKCRYIYGVFALKKSQKTFMWRKEKIAEVIDFLYNKNQMLIEFSSYSKAIKHLNLDRFNKYESDLGDLIN